MAKRPNRLVLLATTLVLSLAGAGQATAQTPADMAALKRYVNSQDYVKLLVDAAAAGEAQTAPDCRDIRPQDRSEFTLFLPPTFAKAAYPVAGAWRDRLKLTRCGQTVYQNVVFMARPDGPPQTALMLPGLSTALPQVQEEALAKAEPVARKRGACQGDDIAVTDTRPDRVLKPSTAKAANGVPLDGQWQETWQFRACGKSVVTVVVFTADGQGGVTTEAR